jgi:hypothetical protein
LRQTPASVALVTMHWLAAEKSFLVIAPLRACSASTKSEATDVEASAAPWYWMPATRSRICLRWQNLRALALNDEAKVSRPPERGGLFLQGRGRRQAARGALFRGQPKPPARCWLARSSCGLRSATISMAGARVSADIV